MTYAETRDAETLRLLDKAILDFIQQCQQRRTNPASACARQTMFFFPGGMASRLVRATKQFDDNDLSPQQFTYDQVWIVPKTLGGGARDLAMYRHSSGTFRDKDDRIIIADDVVGLDLSLGACTPHAGLISWCHNNNVDLFVFPWDWRRRLNETVTFFVEKFLPYFQTLVMRAGCPDPLGRFSVVGHSFGGMIANLILRNTAQILNGITAVITVATPFYGYGGQLHRWFRGEPLLNLFGILEQAMMETIATMPGLYTLHFLDEQTWNDNAALLQSPPFPIATYPSVDKNLTTVRADAYNPNRSGSFVRYPGMTGFDMLELDYAEKQLKFLASPMAPGLLQRFHNIRGVQTALDGTTPINSTPAKVTWDWIKSNYKATDPSPIADAQDLPGDGTQPAWTACLATNARHCITVKAVGIDHMFMMSHPLVLQEIATILCPAGGTASVTATPQPEPSDDEEMVAFLKWFAENLPVVRQFSSFDDEFRQVLPPRFQNRLPNLARRFIRDVMKRPGPKGLSPTDGDAGPQGPEPPNKP